MAILRTSVDGENLLVDDKPVLKGWESFSGWYWLATEDAGTQHSILDSGKEVENDQMWFGYVQGLECEWGYWSEAQLAELGAMVWEIKAQDLPFAGRRR